MAWFLQHFVFAKAIRAISSLSIKAKSQSIQRWTFHKVSWHMALRCYGHGVQGYGKSVPSRGKDDDKQEFAYPYKGRVFESKGQSAYEFL